MTTSKHDLRGMARAAGKRWRRKRSQATREAYLSAMQRAGYAFVATWASSAGFTWSKRDGFRRCAVDMGVRESTTCICVVEMDEDGARVVDLREVRRER